MTKLVKQMYCKFNGEKKLNCYKVTLSKEIVSKTNIKEDDNIRIYTNNNKIIIEKEKKEM